MKLKGNKLMIIAGIVWLIAGINVLVIGLKLYYDYFNIVNMALSVTVFVFFWWVIFKPLVMKHVKRITGYQNTLQSFWLFFDTKSYIMMALMMSMGISIRMMHLLPDVFIAVFYSGLGLALSLAGCHFILSYIQNIN